MGNQETEKSELLRVAAGIVAAIWEREGAAVREFWPDDCQGYASKEREGDKLSVDDEGRGSTFWGPWNGGMKYMAITHARLPRKKTASVQLGVTGRRGWGLSH